jgi:hypothetical protein
VYTYRVSRIKRVDGNRSSGWWWMKSEKIKIASGFNVY